SFSRLLCVLCVLRGEFFLLLRVSASSAVNSFSPLRGDAMRCDAMRRRGRSRAHFVEDSLERAARLLRRFGEGKADLGADPPAERERRLDGNRIRLDEERLEE